MGEESYPPYNIERLDENRFQISVALAGFKPDEVELTVEQNVLTLEGRKGLTLAEKRAVLASLASDASAIASCPSLRAPEGLKVTVTIDEILDALCALDGGPGTRLAANPCGFGRPNAAQRPEAYTVRPSRGTTMFEQNLARIRTPRNNIHRYRRLLRTELSDLERDFIDRRMADEQASLDALVAETFPVTFPLPKDSSSASSSVATAS